MRAAVTGESRPPPYPFPEFLEFLFEICSRASKGRNFEEICGPRPQVRLSGFHSRLKRHGAFILRNMNAAQKGRICHQRYDP